ncbi:MAG: hypothetical protein ACRDMZ_23190, partial [Solirubrobacteraceae bacterium]
MGAMSLDLIYPEMERVAHMPLVVVVAGDELAALRIESVLTVGGMLVETRGLSVDELGHGATADPD